MHPDEFEKLRKIVDPVLEPDERVEYVLGAWQGPLIGNLLAWIEFLGEYFLKRRDLVLTDRRLLVIHCSKMSGEPKRLDAAYPRSSVQVLEHRRNRGLVSPVIRLYLPGGVARFAVFSEQRRHLDGFIKALGPSI